MRKRKPEVADDDFIVGSGDYLKDRGYAEPGEARAKFFLSNQIAIAVETLALSQTEAAKMTGLKQPDISRIVNGNVSEYSVWRLIRVLRDLGWNISIEVRPPSGGGGHIYAVNGTEGDEALPLA